MAAATAGHVHRALRALLQQFSSFRPSRDTVLKICAKLLTRITRQHGCTASSDGQAELQQVATLLCESVSNLTQQSDSARKLWDAIMDTLLLPALPQAFGRAEGSAVSSTLTAALKHALERVLLSREHIAALSAEFPLRKVSPTLASSGPLGGSYAAKVLLPWQHVLASLKAAPQSKNADGPPRRKRRRQAGGPTEEPPDSSVAASLPQYAAWLTTTFAAEWRKLFEEQAAQEAPVDSLPRLPPLADFGVVAALLAASLDVLRSADLVAEDEEAAGSAVWEGAAYTVAALLSACRSARVCSRPLAPVCGPQCRQQDDLDTPASAADLPAYGGFRWPPAQVLLGRV